MLAHGVIFAGQFHLFIVEELVLEECGPLLAKIVVSASDELPGEASCIATAVCADRPSANAHVNVVDTCVVNTGTCADVGLEAACAEPDEEVREERTAMDLGVRTGAAILELAAAVADVDVHAALEAIVVAVEFE